MPAVSTLALDRPTALMAVRGALNTLRWPLRQGRDGALVAPTGTGSSYTVTRRDGTVLVSAAAVTVSSSIATGTWSPAAAETLGAGYTVEATLAFADGSEPFRVREEAFLVSYLPPCTVSERNLYARIPELRHRIPQSQGDRGDGTGWQPQIDDAYHTLLRKLIEDGRRPWAIRDVTGSHDLLLAMALRNAVGTIQYGPDSPFVTVERALYHEIQRAEASFKIQYEDNTPEIRDAGAQSYRLGASRYVIQ